MTNIMNTDLKKAIIDFMFENVDEFQLVNATTAHFRQYIYTQDGHYCIGGEVVSIFIENAEKLIKL